MIDAQARAVPRGLARHPLRPSARATGRRLLAAGLLTITVLPASGQVLGDGIALALQGRRPGAVAVGDLDGDGRDDVVVTDTLCDSTCAVAILYQDPCGELAEPLLYGLWSEGASIALADLNGDDLTDITIGGQRCGFVVFTQLPDHRFYSTEYQSPRCAPEVAAGDVTHDGLTDLVVMPWGSNTDDLYVYEQQEDGTLVRHDWTITGEGEDDLAVADVTGDGLLDVLSVSARTTSQVVVLPGDAVTGFGEEILVATPDWGKHWAVAAGDLNGDGRTDAAVVTDVDGEHVGILFQDQNGQLVPGPLLPVGRGSKSLVVADLDGDGDDDLATAVDYWGIVDWVDAWFQQAGGEFTHLRYPAPPPFSNAIGNQLLGAGDVNGDGRADLVLAIDSGYLGQFFGADLLYWDGFESQTFECWGQTEPTNGLVPAP